VAPGIVRDNLSLNTPEMQESVVERSDLTKLNKAERRDGRERTRIGLCKQCSLELDFGVLSEENTVDTSQYN
jgi:hypothetical protein